VRNMNVLDSRFLQVGDCFVQKFSKPGKFRYIVSTGAALCMSIGEVAHEIIVQSPKADSTKARQHNIVVMRKDAALVAEPSRIEIEQGDMILWHTTETSIQGFAVVGEGENGTFSSVALTNEAVYSHPFGTPGTYEWADAYNGRARGAVVVGNVDAYQPQDCRKLLEALSKGTLIKVTGDRVEPDKIEILAGQTVFWAIEKATGITITDTRLLRRMKDRVSNKD
jgi:plastocyanin